MGRRAVKSLDSWMDEDDANKKKGGRERKKREDFAEIEITRKYWRK